VESGSIRAEVSYEYKKGERGGVLREIQLR